MGVRLRFTSAPVEENYNECECQQKVDEVGSGPENELNDAAEAVHAGNAGCGKSDAAMPVHGFQAREKP